MSGRAALLGLAAICTLSASAAIAQQNSAQPMDGESQNGRYTMSPAPNGFLRLDTRTGAVALCTLRDGAVTCASSADERGALENEIARLAKDNDALRERLADITQRSPAAQPRAGLPDAAEMNRALGFAEIFMRKMMQIMREEGPKGDRL